jgi:hypothetical protein
MSMGRVLLELVLIFSKQAPALSFIVGVYLSIACCSVRNNKLQI